MPGVLAFSMSTSVYMLPPFFSSRVRGARQEMTIKRRLQSRGQVRHPTDKTATARVETRHTLLVRLYPSRSGIFHFSAPWRLVLGNGNGDGGGQGGRSGASSCRALMYPLKCEPRAKSTNLEGGSFSERTDRFNGVLTLLLSCLGS